VAEPIAASDVKSLPPTTHPATLLLDVVENRDRELEAKLARQVRGFKGVTVIPEPFGAGALADDLRRAVADPAARPRSDKEKQATAKVAAQWLNQIAIGAVPGYSIAEAAQADMRKALASDDLAPELIDGLAKLGSGDTQLALVQLATAAGRPVAVRVQAADAAARHIQAFGRSVPVAAAQTVPQAVEGEKDAILQGKLAVLARLVSDKPGDFGAAVSGFTPPLRTPAPPPMPPMGEQPKPEEKK
jgi:hypothetical protein